MLSRRSAVTPQVTADRRGVVEPPRPLTELEVRRLGALRRFFAVHPVASDVLVCLLVVASTASGLALTVTTGVGATAPVLLVQGAAGLIGLVAIVFRRRWPVTVLATVTGTIAASVLLPSGEGIPAGDAALPFALYAVAANRRPVVAWSAFAGMTGLLTAAFASTTRSAALTGVLSPVVSASSTDQASYPLPDWGPFTGFALSALLGYVVIGLGYLAVGLSVYGRRQQVADLVRRSYELVAAGEQQARLASMQERTRIAREMHDVVAHSLSVMVALSDGARASVRRAPGAAEEALDMASETGRAALADMRRMLGVLRDGDGAEPSAPGGSQPPPAARPSARRGAQDTGSPPVPPADEVPWSSAPAGRPDPAATAAVTTDPLAPTTPQPTAGDDLDALVEGFRRAGLPVRSRAAELPEHGGLRLAVFRVIQESLTNVLRHAAGVGSVEVLVDVLPEGVATPARVRVVVTDDGGAQVPRAAGPAGRGLVGMRERAALFEGTVSAGPYRGGWRVQVELAVPPDAGPRPSQVWKVPT
ncbi:MAG: hypothetical protein KJ792_13030 [Actinobacteria bacterium]|nr:hypothetical protein [Actinomycetota bacterium]